MAQYLDPKNDLTFRRVFGEHKHLCDSVLVVSYGVNTVFLVSIFQIIFISNVSFFNVKSYLCRAMF